MSDESESHVRNMTPHAIVLRTPERDYVFPPDPAGPARVATITLKRDCPEGQNWPLVETEYGKPAGLPSYQKGTILIVSRLVRNACSRDDVVCPAGHWGWRHPG